MDTTISIDDAIATYPDEWILLDELQTQDNLTVQVGRVVGHDPDRSVVQNMAIEMGLERCVVVCARLKDGKPGISRDYAVSPITSAQEIESVVAGE